MQSTITFAILALPFLVSARFGQENAAQAAIQAIDGTLAGQSISTLLAGSSGCDKLSLADEVAAIGGAAALSAAKALVQAEKNFNPFVADGPNVCDDATLPATAELRGIIPLIDPEVEGAAAVNTASAASLDAPVTQDGSTADLLLDLGFETFSTDNGAAGGAADDAAADDNAAADDAAADNNNNNDDNAAADDAAADDNNNNNDAAADDNNNNDDAATDNNNNDDAAADNAACNANNNNDDNAAAAEDDAADNATADNAAVAATAGNLQTFSGALGGVAAEPISDSGNPDRPFEVAGSTFVGFGNAATRTCDRQFNACANLANGGDDTIAVSDCTAQKDQCQAAQDGAAATSFRLKRRAVRMARRAAAARRA